MMRFVAATNNIDKLKELRSILTELGIEIMSLNEVGFCEEIEETGDSFEANARIKAETVMRATGFAALADDSGLVIDALGGAPGIYSARFAEPGFRKKKVLEQMEGLPKENRTARFVSAIACVFPGGESVVVRGTCEGVILEELRGMGGFGYDPLFYVPEYAMTFAEMPSELKNRISHRALALQALEEKLKVRNNSL